MAEKRVDDATEVVEIGADRPFYQIGLRLVHRTADVKLERGTTGLGSWHKILANPTETIDSESYR